MASMVAKSKRRRAAERRRGQFEGLDLGRQRRAIGVVGEDRVGELALGQRRERLALLVEGGRTTLIADRGGTKDIAVGVDCKRQRMADARIGRVALIVIVDGLARVAEEHRVAVRPLRLHGRQPVAALGDAIGQCRLGRAVVGIDLLTQDAALQRPRGLARVVAAETGRQNRCPAERWPADRRRKIPGWRGP